MLYLPRRLVDNLPLPPELRAIHLDRADVTHTPADAQVDLLDLPVLEEDGAPDAGDDAIEEGVFASEEPGDDAGAGWENEEDEICLDKGKVKGYLQSQQKLRLVFMREGRVRKSITAPWIQTSHEFDRGPR